MAAAIVRTPPAEVVRGRRRVLESRSVGASKEHRVGGRLVVSVLRFSNAIGADSRGSDWKIRPSTKYA